MVYNEQSFGFKFITYQMIVMEQVQIIQKIYSKELRNGDKIFKNAIGEQTIEGEDTRYSFLQAVEFFGDLLTPYFIEGTETYTGIKLPEFLAYSDLLDKELITMLEDEKFLKEIKKVFFLDKDEKIENKIKTDEKFRNQLNLFFLNYKIKEARRIFRRLVELFKEHDFLTTQGYVDQEDESMVYDEARDGDLRMVDEDEA
jgi:hypothetical protein